MNLQKIPISAEVLTIIADILHGHFDVQEAIDGIYMMTGGGANDANHVVAQTISGCRFGIKTRARGGGQNGENREAAFSKACTEYGIKEASRAVCVERIPGLAGFDNEVSVITEWVPRSKQVAEITPDERDTIQQDLERILTQVGKWITVNLHLGLGDRHLKNWVWSQEDGRLTAIDTEAAFGSANIGDHHSIVDAFYDRRKLKTERGTSKAAIAFERALRDTHSMIRTKPQIIADVAAGIESAKNHTSPFVALSEDEFVNRVFEELS